MLPLSASFRSVCVVAVCVILLRLNANIHLIAVQIGAFAAGGAESSAIVVAKAVSTLSAAVAELEICVAFTVGRPMSNDATTFVTAAPSTVSSGRSTTS